MIYDLESDFPYDLESDFPITSISQGVYVYVQQIHTSKQ